MSGRAEIVPDMLPRIRAAAVAVREAEDARALRLTHRDELIVAAVDQGVSQRAIAAAAGLSRARIVGLLLAAGATDAAATVDAS